jgi:hypothetical protein
VHADADKGLKRRPSPLALPIPAQTGEGVGQFWSYAQVNGNWGQVRRVDAPPRDAGTDLGFFAPTSGQKLSKSSIASADREAN